MGFGGSVEQVKANLLLSRYPEKQMHFIKGDVLHTIPAQSPSHIALLRLDTDWYKSTLHELAHLYDLIVPHGVLIIDDYGWCRGARQATDEFFRDRPFKPMLHRVDQGPRIAIKPVCLLIQVLHHDWRGTTTWMKCFWSGWFRVEQSGVAIGVREHRCHLKRSAICR
jgi:Macrocin-O-methyltransferase (TylF)